MCLYGYTAGVGDERVYLGSKTSALGIMGFTTNAYAAVRNKMHVLGGHLRSRKITADDEKQRDLRGVHAGNAHIFTRLIIIVV